MSQLDLFSQFGPLPDPASKKKGKEGGHGKGEKVENGSEQKNEPGNAVPQQSFFPHKADGEIAEGQIIRAPNIPTFQQSYIMIDVPSVETKSTEVDIEQVTTVETKQIDSVLYDLLVSEESAAADNAHLGDGLFEPVEGDDKEFSETEMAPSQPVEAMSINNRQQEEALAEAYELLSDKGYIEEDEKLAADSLAEEVGTGQEDRQQPAGNAIVETSAGAEVTEEGQVIQKPVSEEFDRPTEVAVPAIETKRISEVVFTDGKIGVKLKKKSPATVQLADEPKVLEEKIKIKKLPQKRGRKSFKEIDAEVDLIEVPEDEELFKKQYYPISTVATWFRVNTSLLRFWENEFDILKPRKNRKGDRMFRPEDVKNLVLIYHLLREKKFTIDGAKEFIKNNKRKADTQLQLTQTLQKFKSFLLELKANLQP